jgi:ubiquinone/menaquinone biosynthesis C-methylase UbiE
MTEPTDVAITRAAYDIVAADYAELLRDELAEKPHDRAVLAAFAELIGDGLVADIGCGPGRVTAHLAGLGVEAFGIDLSPEMIAVARRSHPELRFELGTMAELELPDATLSGVVAWYSIIHTPPERLPQVFAEFARVLRPGGLLQLAFQVGDERRRIESAYGHEVSLDAYRLRPERIAELADAAGFALEVQLVRSPAPGEKTDQAFLLLRRR